MLPPALRLHAAQEQHQVVFAHESAAHETCHQLHGATLPCAGPDRWVGGDRADPRLLQRLDAVRVGAPDGAMA